MGDTSIHCDRREHEKCDGTAVIMDQDGASRYVCACGCHNAKFRERDCPNCKGTGRLHDERSYGRYSTNPGPLPSSVGT